MIEQHASLSEKFVKKWIWLYAFSFIIGPLWYLGKIIVSWELSVSEVGILYGIISLITLLSAYNDIGLTDSFNYFIPKYITEKRYDKVKTILAYAFIAQMTTGVSIALFFFFWADFIAENYFKTDAATWVLKIFALFFLWVNVFEIISTFFMVIQNTFLNKIHDFIRSISLAIFIVSVYFLDLSSITNFSYGWIVALYIGIMSALYVFWKKYYIPYLREEKIIWERKIFWEIFKYASTIFIWVQASVILSQVDMQMIIYILGTTDAGYYTNYLSIISIPFLIIGPIFWLLYPMFSEMHSKWKTEEIRIVKSVFQKNFLVISLWFNILFFVFAEILAYILFGEKFLKSWEILQYSILFLVFNFLFQMNLNIMWAIWKVKERIYIVLMVIVINTTLNYIFLSSIWVQWAALASGIGWFFMLVFSEYYLWKDYKTSIDWKYLLKNSLLLISLWTILSFYIIPLFYWIGRWMSLLGFFIVSFLYFWLLWFLNMKEFKYFISQIRRPKKKKENT